MFSDIVFVIPAATAQSTYGSTLAIMSANARGIPTLARRQAYQELFEQKLSPKYGGKGAWDTVVSDLAERIGYETAGSIRFTIEHVWAKFIEANVAFIDEGNALIVHDMKSHGKVQPDTLSRLKTLRRLFKFPKELEFYIRAHTDELKGIVIARSSGRYEDSYLRNLAGIFISPKKRDERLVVYGIKQIFENAVEQMWIDENEKEVKTEGIPNTLASNTGFGVLVQPFLQFDASGTAMTDLYGHVSIEAVVGDADMAVNDAHANAVQFVFDKKDPSRMEYNPTFLEMPYQWRLKGKEYSAKDNLDEMRQVLSNYPKILGKFSPLSEAQAREAYRVSCALQEEIGVPLDIEWGVINKNKSDWKLYIIQVRPIIGDFQRPLVEIGRRLKRRKAIARTPIAIGHTASSGFRGKMVVFESTVKDKSVREFEDKFGEDYIRVQDDVASAVDGELKMIGLKTQGKVLVDPMQGSRQAHNVNYIMNRIAANEFAYCNGPILKEGLLKNIHFTPHPNIKGVWISEENVTYFCDGLRGSFYRSGSVKTVAPALTAGPIDAQRMLSIIQNEINTPLGEEDSRDRLQRVAKEIGLIGADIFLSSILNGSFERSREQIEEAAKKSQVPLEEYARRFEILQNVLRFPLLSDDAPFASDLNMFTTYFIHGYRNHVELARMIQSNEAAEQNAPQPKVLVQLPQKPVRPEKLKILILDEQASDRHTLPRDLKDKLGTNEYEFHFANNYVTAFRELWNQKFDGVIFDWVMNDAYTEDLEDSVMGKLFGDKPLPSDMRNSSFSNLFLRQLRDVPNIVINTGADHGKVRKKVQKVAGKDVAERMKYGSIAGGIDLYSTCLTLKEWREGQLKAYEKALAEWEAAQAAVGTAKPALNIPMSEELQILFVHDDKEKLRSMKVNFKKWFGLTEKSPECLGGEGYLVSFVASKKEAEEIVRTKHIDYIITDWLLEEDSADHLLVYAAHFGLKRADIISGMPDCVDRAKHRCPGLEIGEFPYYKDDGDALCMERIKQVREEHIKEYHAAMQNKNSTDQPPTKPEKPGKVKVLLIDDSRDITESFTRRFNDELSAEEYELTAAHNAQEVSDALQASQYDLIIYDFKMPDFEDVKDLLLTSDAALLLYTGYQDEYIQRDMPPELKEVTAFVVHKPCFLGEAMFPHITAIRQEKLAKYEKALVVWKSAQSEVQIQKAPAQPPKLKILLVQDEENITALYQRGFSEKLGAKRINDNHYSSPDTEIYFADNETEALRILSAEGIDYVVVDWVLRGTAVWNVMNVVQEKGIKWIDIDTGNDDFVWTAEKQYPGLNIKEFPGYQRDYISRIKEVIELQVQQWQAVQPTAQNQATLTQQPAKPEKLRIVMIADPGTRWFDVADEEFPELFGTAEYEFCSFCSVNDAVLDLADKKIDYCIVDWNGTGIADAGLFKRLYDRFEGRVYGLNIVSGWFDSKAMEVYKENVRAAGIPDGERISAGRIPRLNDLKSSIKKARERQIVDYEKALTEWAVAHPAISEPQGPKTLPGKSEKETLFLFTNIPTEHDYLKSFILDKTGDKYNIVGISLMAELSINLKWGEFVPDIVVADDAINNNYQAKEIMRLVREKNPKAKFIFLSEEAAIPKEEFATSDVLAILERPFHFHDVLDVLNGTYADRVSTAGVRFKIEESTNVVNSVEKAHAIDKPGIIRVWEGYAAPQFQKNMLIRLRTKTENGPYRIGFDKDLDDLVDFACQEAKNDNAVTILPFNKLTDRQRKRLELAGAHVIFIDFKEQGELGTDDIVQLGAIVFTGIAYLNNNDNALMRLYKLLTGERHDDVTIEQLKKNPSLLIFIFEPTSVHNYNELKHLNDLMEKEILSAA